MGSSCFFHSQTSTYIGNLSIVTPHGAAHMHQWTGSGLVQVMACRLFGAKPLPEPMLAYCQLDSYEHISVKFESESNHFHSRKWIWNCRLPKWRPFCPGVDELNIVTPSLRIWIRVIGNNDLFWRPKLEPSICPMQTVQNQPTNNAIQENKNTTGELASKPHNKHLWCVYTTTDS